jgi:hypothetical protein
VAAPTARLLAGRALTRGQALHVGDPVTGLSCTATIATDRPKRGEHRGHIAAWQTERITTHTLYLDKGARSRAGEEALLSRLILNVLAEALGLPTRLDLDLRPADSYSAEIVDLSAAATALHRERVTTFCISADGEVIVDGPPPAALLSGAFNPLHSGHCDLAVAAAAFLGEPVSFELAARNADKPPLPPAIVLPRLAQFAGRWTVYASHAATFVAKARLYPGTTFVVGFDTAQRILETRFYENSREKMIAALQEISDRGCRFLVAGRIDESGDFHTADALSPPPGLAHLFQPLPDFRRDISSTELRRLGAHLPA